VEKLSAKTGKKTQAATARAPKQNDKAPPRDLHFATGAMLKNHHRSFHLLPGRRLRWNVKIHDPEVDNEGDTDPGANSSYLPLLWKGWLP
jgi:hypothetical protein